MSDSVPVERGLDPRLAEIRAAAVRLFAVKGYHATSMADIAAAIGIRAPSIYHHVQSKQNLLREIILATLLSLAENFSSAVGSETTIPRKLRRAVEAHVRYHARHRYEAYVGTREIRHLAPEALDEVLRHSAAYERGFRELITSGIESGDFSVESPRLASCAILDLGIGISSWYEEGHGTSEDDLVYHYGTWAMRIVQPGSPLPPA